MYCTNNVPICTAQMNQAKLLVSLIFVLHTYLMSMTLARERLMLTIALFCPSTGGGGGTIDPWYPGSKETLSHLISSEINNTSYVHLGFY